MHRFGWMASSMLACTGALGACVAEDTAQSSANVGADASAPNAAPCNLDAPFGRPTDQPFLNVNTVGQEESAYLLPDELSVYFSSPRAIGDGVPSYDIFRARRASRSAAFGVPVPIPGLVNEPGASEERGPIVAPDDLTLVFTKRKPGTTSERDIWWSKRKNAEAPWPAATPVENVNGPGNDVAGDLAGGDLWLSSDRSGNGIFRAPESDGGFSTPKPLSELGPGATSPRLSSDGLRIFYGRDAGTGTGTDIWTGVRTSTTAEFSDLSPIPSVNSTGDDVPAWISPDGCRLYLTSNRRGGPGLSDIYIAERPR